MMPHTMMGRIARGASARRVDGGEEKEKVDLISRNTVLTVCSTYSLYDICVPLAKQTGSELNDIDISNARA
jgi:hypothetical protein